MRLLVVEDNLPLLDSIKAKNPGAARKAFNKALNEWLKQARSIVYDESEQ